MNNIFSYCGLVDVWINKDKDLPVYRGISILGWRYLVYWLSWLLCDAEVLTVTKHNLSIFHCRQQQSECWWFSYTSWLCLPPLWRPSKADDILCSKIQCYSYFYTSKVSVLIIYLRVTLVGEFCGRKSTGSRFLKTKSVSFFLIGIEPASSNIRCHFRKQNVIKNKVIKKCQ